MSRYGEGRTSPTARCQSRLAASCYATNLVIRELLEYGFDGQRMTSGLIASTCRSTGSGSRPYFSESIPA